jgi:C1A family cysteine protease
MSGYPATVERQHVYGWRRPLPGQYLAYPPADTEGLPISPQVDPRAKLPPIFNQGQLGSCTANATAGAFQYDGILDGKNPGLLARLWIYYFERAIEGTLGQGDCGATGHDAFTVAKHGIPDETLWPYDISTFQDKPGPDEPRAYYLKKPVAAPAQTEEAVKRVLSNSQTISFGFTVYQSFESEKVAETGIMPVPRSGEAILGGHEVLAVGYLEDRPDYVLCRNSWGTGWGLDGDGYFLFPWSVFLNPNMASDFRTIVRAV